jgi:hypothetical protein
MRLNDLKKYPDDKLIDLVGIGLHQFFKHL